MNIHEIELPDGKEVSDISVFQLNGDIKAMTITFKDCECKKGLFERIIQALSNFCWLFGKKIPLDREKVLETLKTGSMIILISLLLSSCCTCRVQKNYYIYDTSLQTNI